MPGLTSSLTATSGLPGVHANHIGKFPGLAMHFGSHAAWLAAVTSTADTANWADGQPMTKADEADSESRRVWRTSLGHARTVFIDDNTKHILAADSNIVRGGSGKPANTVGADGDIWVDRAAGKVYIRASGVWGYLKRIRSAPVINTAVTSSGVLTLEALGAVTPVNAASATVQTLPSAAAAWALEPYAFVILAIKGSGIPTFAVGGTDSLRAPASAAVGEQYGMMAAQVISATEWARA